MTSHYYSQVLVQSVIQGTRDKITHATMGVYFMALIRCQCVVNGILLRWNVIIERLKRTLRKVCRWDVIKMNLKGILKARFTGNAE